MNFNQERLDRLLQEDYLAHGERLRVWVEAAEEMLEAGESRQEVMGLLFWAKVEFHRRRTYLGLEEPELERRAASLVRTLGKGE